MGHIPAMHREYPDDASVGDVDFGSRGIGHESGRQTEYFVSELFLQPVGYDA